MVVSPELADVLSTIISRIREPNGAVPPVAVYDDHERLWLAPAPVLFQRRIGGENRAIPAATIRRLLAAALARTGLTGPSGEPLHYTPHDFRRMFLTDAILNGLPPHIAQVIAGHRDINVTLGYKAAYPDEAIQAHLAFLARRRALRPTEEYRTPTDAEWAEFLGHFERRKVATGLCGRAFGTPCLHEHSCLRCALHWSGGMLLADVTKEVYLNVKHDLTCKSSSGLRPADLAHQITTEFHLPEDCELDEVVRGTLAIRLAAAYSTQERSNNLRPNLRG
jgi:hypothetical protein